MPCPNDENLNGLPGMPCPNDENLNGLPSIRCPNDENRDVTLGCDAGPRIEGVAPIAPHTFAAVANEAAGGPMFSLVPFGVANARDG